MSLMSVLLDDVMTPTSPFGFAYDLKPVVLPSAVCLCPLRRISRQRSDKSCLLTDDKYGFQVNLDVQQFKPEEITVKTVDNCITIEGKHEEKPDEHGSIARHFLRRYMLPNDVDAEQTKCQLSSDGVLCVCVPKKLQNDPDSKERSIPITFTATPAVKATSLQAASAVDNIEPLFTKYRPETPEDLQEK